jgi:hypothetical protein
MSIERSPLQAFSAQIFDKFFRGMLGESDVRPPPLVAPPRKPVGADFFTASMGSVRERQEHCSKAGPERRHPLIDFRPRRRAVFGLPIPFAPTFAPELFCALLPMCFPNANLGSRQIATIR